MYILGFDIGGTKCAVVTALWDGDEIRLLKKDVCSTDLGISPDVMIEKLINLADGILTEKPDAIGISCGGPLDSRSGTILGPPNLPGWNHVEIVKKIENYYGVPTQLQNDADACAVAEWKFGAGRGCKNMIFLTFGTGLGAGLILNGQLYSGACNMAGEAGHIRLNDFGPVGYGKAGSFEGFCSGNGIKQLGMSYATEKLQLGQSVSFCNDSSELDSITAKKIAECANAGAQDAQEIYRICGEMLGKGLSILIDILNPEKIIIGSIYQRCENLLFEPMNRVLAKECLSASYKACQVTPAELVENIGDYAAVATAITDRKDDK